VALSLVIHGHFYQPPREDPFLDVVEAEPSAAPYHDWNQRIERECYRAVVAARLTGAEGRIRGIVNTLEWISFDFGPTLLEWMEREAPDTYQAILAADRASAARLGGHGNAMAQPYHHSILPLASWREKLTEVRWGVADFRRRYGRDPEGMWLPEAALDGETLDVLAREGIRFTIVAPHQVLPIPARGAPGLYRTASGREIALCVYNGDLSHGIAFGGLLHDAQDWVVRMISLGNALARGLRPEQVPLLHTQAPPERRTVVTPEGSLALAAPLEGEALVAAASDGETYGHHHKFGEMALAYAIEQMGRLGARLENFSAWLARNPASEAVQIVEPSSWSCPHGVERWRANCGCRLDGEKNPSQEWRTPLRQGLEELAAKLHQIFEQEATRYFPDPWQAREGYGAVVAADPASREQYVQQTALLARTAAELVRARELLEMERDSLRMFTSCAWFFDDIGGIEARQILRYAARAIELAGAAGPQLEEQLLARLAAARSNDPSKGTGKDIYLSAVKPRYPAPARIAAAARAAVHLGAAARHAALGTVAIQQDRVRVAEPRTGRVTEWEARVVEATPSRIQIEVRREGAAYQIGVADFPERPRRLIQAALKRAVLVRWLTQEQLEQILAGDLTVDGALRMALVRAVERLADLPLEEAIPPLLELLDILEYSQQHIPFDAQTVFWKIWRTTSSERRAQLAHAASRLGFSLDSIQA
jgi:hypothetical protein